MKDHTNMDAGDKAEMTALGNILNLISKSNPLYAELKKRYDKLVKKGK